MTARPFYRWKSFWLGVVALLFLGWGWYRAVERNGGVLVITPAFNVGVNQYEGQVGFYVNLSKQKWAISSASSLRWDKVGCFPPPWDVEVSRTGGTVYGERHVHARFAHWFLMLVFVTVWSAWLAWKWKREQMRMAR